LRISGYPFVSPPTLSCSRLFWGKLGGS